MAKLAYRSERCKGCLLCIDACKMGVLSACAKRNALGYETVAVDKDTCVLCGSCCTVCPDCCFEIREDAE